MFMLDGKKVRTENGAPYALGGDSPSGNYHAFNFTPGDHTLTAIPYNKYDGNGTAGIPRTIHFSVVGQSVESFTLINAETNQSIPERLDGGVLNLNSLPLQLNIRANTNPGKVGSVVFIYDGKKIRTENGIPYALGGDNPSGNYHSFPLTLGSHTLTAIPYSNYNGTGTKGLEKTIHFTVVRRNRVSLPTVVSPADIPVETRRLGLYPNPVHNLLTISADGFNTGSSATISIVNMLGEVIETRQLKNMNQVIQLDVSSLSPGNYFLRIVAGEKVLNKRFVKL